MAVSSLNFSNHPVSRPFLDFLSFSSFYSIFFLRYQRVRCGRLSPIFLLFFFVLVQFFGFIFSLCPDHLS